MSDLFELQHHTVLRASAGTGKTEALTNQYLRLVTGATSFGRPIPPRRIVAVTFTEKAAAEMRHRIHRALWELKSDVPDAQALHSVRQLRSVLSEHDISLVPDTLSELLQGLATARIMTIHALCLSLLQDHASYAGMDPHFTVLDDERATVLLERAIESVAMDHLEAGSASINKLLDETGGFYPMLGRGIVPMLKQLYLNCKEAGSPVETICETSAFSNQHYPGLQLQILEKLGIDSRQELSAVWQRLLQTHRALCEPTQGIRQHKPTVQRLTQCIAQLEAQSPCGAQTIDELAAAQHLLQQACGSGQTKDQEPAAGMREAIRQLWALPHAKEYAASIRELLIAVEARYSHLKHMDGLVDYQDLTLGARRLLTENADIQRQVAAGIDVLMVDEFQDTNAAQRDIIQCLVDIHSGSIGNSRLFVVGDSKQSIYGFRGADVLVFEQFVQKLQHHGAQTAALQTSYRSSPQLLHGLNILSHAALQPTTEDPSDLEFTASDTLYPPTPDGFDQSSAVPVIELLGDPEQLRDPETEAHWIASRAAELVSSEEKFVRDNGVLRQVRFSDMALLLPRFTHIQVFLGALQELGIPFTAIRSKGLMSSVEARDIVSIIKVLLNQYETVDLLAVLRSPCCSCSDQTLVELASALRNHTNGLQRLINVSLDFIDAAEKERFERCTSLLLRLQGSVEALGIGRSLTLLLTHCQYTAVLAGLPSAHQRLSNVDRILEEITSREHQSDAASKILKDLLRRQRLGTGDYETAVALDDADVLSVMTIHQAKGLEFPVVFAADLGRKLPTNSGLAMYDATSGSGLSIAVRGSHGEVIIDPHSQRVRDRLKARQAAENKRLFYVQITRARDRLILSGKNQGLLKALRQSAIPMLLEQRLLLRPSLGDVTLANKSATLSLPDDEKALPAAFPANPPLNPTHKPSLEVSVTALQDFSLCPRRYRATHVLRLPQIPRIQAADTAEPMIDPRERGTRLHAALEHLDLAAAVQDPSQAANSALSSLPPGLKADLLPRLVGFLQNSYVRGLTDVNALQREIPFALQVASTTANAIVHGQIDLLRIGESTLDIIDYKVTSPKSANPVGAYIFQLDVYALAAHRQYGGMLKVNRGVQFLDGQIRLPIFIDTPFSPSEVEAQLTTVTDDLLRAQASGAYPGRPKEYCDRIACGYRWLCHPRHATRDSAVPIPCL